MFGVYEDLVFSVDKTGSCGVISGLRGLIVGMAPSVALWLRPRGYECVVVCARPRHAGPG